MKAIAVYPGKPHSMHLEGVPMLNIVDIPGDQGLHRGRNMIYLRNDEEKDHE
jgi:hypothetical protein